MDNRQKLSVTLITFNEEKRVRDALQSVIWADEIVVVDSLSTDATRDICLEYTPHVYKMPWQGFVAQKNLATAKTTFDWVLNIDADERVSPELAQEIQSLLAGTPQADGYYMPRKTFYLGDWINHCGWSPDHKLRLFRKSCGQWVGRELHEKIAVQGSVAYLRQPLEHYSYENISDHLRRIDRYTTLSAAQKHGTPGSAGIFLRTVGTFFKKYLLQQGFRDGTRGMIVCLLAAFYEALKYAKLWERQLTAEDRKGGTPC